MDREISKEVQRKEQRKHYHDLSLRFFQVTADTNTIQ